MIALCFRYLMIGAGSLLLAACGGGGGGVPPPPGSYSIGGTVSGLASGTQLVLSNNGGNSTTISADGSFTFSTTLKPSASYAVTIQTQPSGQTCTVSNASGTVSAANVTTVSVACVATPYTVSGLVFGLASGTQLDLLNGGTTLTVTTNGVFSFPSGFASGANYAVTINAPAAGQNCVISNPSGAIASASVSNVIVTCSPTSASSPVLLELGHIASINQVKMTSTRALSQDTLAHWNLWNLTDNSIIANGYSACISTQCETSATPVGNVALTASTYVIETETALEIGASDTGQVLATVPGPVDWWRLASDGSYIAIGTSTGVRAVSPTGATLFSVTGNYSEAVAYALPGQLLVAESPAGANVIQTILLSNGSVSNGPAFQGQFSEWFVDGSHYQTAIGGTVYTYSNLSAQEDITSLGSSISGSYLGGTGNWFWAQNGANVNIYKVGSSTSATASYQNGGYPLPFTASGTTLAFDNDVLQLQIVDLSGSIPSVTIASVPSGLAAAAFGAASATQWILGSSQGVLFDGTSTSSNPRYLALGRSYSITGSGEIAAIATAAGQIFVVNAQTDTLLTTISGYASNLQISADGTVLAALGNFPEEPQAYLVIFSLPAASVIQTFDDENIYEFTLAPTGTLIARGGSGNMQITNLAGSQTLWSGPADAVLFSPDGTKFAAQVGDPTAEATYINLYSNYQLTGAVTGVPLTWIGNTELVTDQYSSSPGCACFAYTATTVFNTEGTSIASFASIPKLPSAQQASPTGFWSIGTNAIYSVTTGATTWTGTPPSTFYYVGSVVGNNVVSVYGSQVLAEPISVN